MKFKDNLELIGAIFIICIVFFLGKRCGDNKQNIIKPDNSIVKTIVKYRDTIFPKDTVYLYKIKIGKSKVDTFYKPVYLDSTTCNKVYVYNDSLIAKDYNIYSKTHVQGTLRNLELGVKLKVPLIIKDSIIIKKDSLIYKPSKYELHIGLNAGSNMLAPSIELSINKLTYMVGYNPFNNNPIIGIKYRLWKSKNK
jgi:hypothetical protein